MQRPQIALLNAAHEAADTRRNFQREIDADLIEFHAPSGELPDSFAFDGCVVTGSKASVYWDEPWIGRLKEWVGDAVQAGLPFLGVCYGHQLLADVTGGQVEPMGEYEIGYRTVNQIRDNLLLDGVDEEFTVFTTHSDRVRTAPPGSEVFAQNDYGIHGFRKDRVFSVQFHPEYDMQTARSVTTGKDELDDETTQDVLAGITQRNYRSAREATKLFDNFLSFVERAQDKRTAVDRP